MEATRFVAVPTAVLGDRRLTMEQLRVLLALYSFKGKDGDVVFPSRQAIADLTGMHQANISTATSALERLGWLTKDGKGGHSKATRYTLTIPPTVAEQATVAQSATKTVAEQATVSARTVADSARGRVAYSARGKEHTNRTNKTSTASADFDPLKWLTERGVTETHGRDWLAVRKTKKAANTETAFTAVLFQANLAGWSLDRAVQVMAEKAWQGFKAEWVKDYPRSSEIPLANQIIGATRNRGGRDEVFTETAGWVPA